MRVKQISAVVILFKSGRSSTASTWRVDVNIFPLKISFSMPFISVSLKQQWSAHIRVLVLPNWYVNVLTNPFCSNDVRCEWTAALIIKRTV